MQFTADADLTIAVFTAEPGSKSEEAAQPIRELGSEGVPGGWPYRSRVAASTRSGRRSTAGRPTIPPSSPAGSSSSSTATSRRLPARAAADAAVGPRTRRSRRSGAGSGQRSRPHPRRITSTGGSSSSRRALTSGRRRGGAEGCSPVLERALEAGRPRRGSTLTGSAKRSRARSSDAEAVAGAQRGRRLQPAPALVPGATLGAGLRGVRRVVEMSPAH